MQSMLNNKNLEGEFGMCQLPGLLLLPQLKPCGLFSLAPLLPMEKKKKKKLKTVLTEIF